MENKISEEMLYEGSPQQKRDELEDLVLKLRLKIKNQKKHLRWFNRQYDSYNRGRKMGQREGSLLGREQDITCREDLAKLSTFLHNKLDHMNPSGSIFDKIFGGKL